MEVADILRAQGSRFLSKYQASFGYQKLKAFRAHPKLPHGALGGHLDACSNCGQQAISYNSCRNRHCPKCQAQARQRWVADREREVLPTRYFHIVFSVPHELNVFALENPRAFYDRLFSASAASALEMAVNPERLGAEIGMIAILHTWGQNLLLHPHIHCVVPAGGLSPDHQHGLSSGQRFFLPVRALRRLFRGKSIDELKRLYRRRKLGHAGPAAVFSEPKQFAKLVGRLRRQDWVVYAKPAFGGPLQVLRYLGRHTHRVAISNHRLLAFDGERVIFRWRDYAHGNQSRVMTLDAVEFLRRFFLHILPKGFVRIRHFGFLANCFRTQWLSLCRQLHDAVQPEPIPPGPSESVSSLALSALWRFTDHHHAFDSTGTFFKMHTFRLFLIRRRLSCGSRRVQRTPSHSCVRVCSERLSLPFDKVTWMPTYVRTLRFPTVRTDSEAPFPENHEHRIGFYLHRPRPPQPPAPSFKSPRRCPAICTSTHPGGPTFPIKTYDFPSKWISIHCAVTRKNAIAESSLI